MNQLSGWAWLLSRSTLPNDGSRGHTNLIEKMLWLGRQWYARQIKKVCYESFRAVQVLQNVNECAAFW